MNKKTYISILSALLVLGGLAHADVILDIDYTTAQGYADGKLQFQSGWLGQASAQVATAGTGVVTSVGGPYDRNAHGTGVRGGVAGVPTMTGAFQKYESIKITFKYSFTLPSDGNMSMGTAGIRPDGPNAGNGFNATPTQGFKMEYNAYDANPTVSDDGGVKFFPSKTDTINDFALILEGTAVGISPGIADGSAADLESDPLEIEYIATRNGTGGFNVTSFKVTNLTTAQVFTYNKAIRTFNWYATDPEVDPYLDAFFAQQLAPNGNAAFAGRTDGVKVEYLPAPPSRPVFDFHFTTAEGFTTGLLAGQNGWVGQTANVDASGTGTVTSTSYLRNMYNNGLLGSSAGNPATALEEFTIGESVEVVVDYQFVLPSTTNNNLGMFGFRTEGPNAENGFNSGPLEGFSMKFNGFNGANTGGLLQVFPDAKDEVGDPVDLANALLISGNDVGIDPFDDLSNGVDLTSDRLRFTYTLLIDEQDPLGNDGIWDGLFVVTSLKVENLDTLAVFNYSGPTQNIFWNDTADEDGLAFEDAFFAQQYTRTGVVDTFGTVDRSAVSFLAPSSEEETLVVDSVVVTGGNLVVNFTGTPGASYKLTESADLVTAFADTDPLQSVTTDGTTGAGTLSLPVSGDKNFVRVESN